MTKLEVRESAVVQALACDPNRGKASDADVSSREREDRLIWDQLRELQAQYNVLCVDTMPLGSSKQTEQRSHQRFRTPNLKGTVWYEDREIEVEVIDTGMGGVRIHGDLRDIPVAAELVLALHLDENRPLIAAATVAWSWLNVAGLRFLGLAPVQVLSLIHYLLRAEQGPASQSDGLL